jgi:hypothetical protein
MSGFSKRWEQEQAGHIHSFGLGYPDIYFKNYTIIFTKSVPKQVGP